MLDIIGLLTPLGSTLKATASLLSLILFGLGKALTGLVQLFQYALHLRLDTNIYVISYSWGIIRDFCNMLFIVALIVMAFATIFEFSQYNFRSLIAKFLIAALLINFSLVIGGIIIDVSDTVSQTFLASIGNAADRIGQALSPTILLNPYSQTNIATTVSISDLSSLIVQMTMSIVLIAIVVVSILAAAAVAIARIPILSILLILSPLAWLLSILPNTRAASEKWWKQFIGWNLFLPIFLFILYFGMFFFSYQEDFVNKMSPQVSGATVIQGFGYSFQILFYYFMAGFIFIGGTGMALSGAFGIGGGAVGVAKWARQGILGWTGRVTGYTAAQRGVGKAVEKLKEEGLRGRVGQFLYGGEAKIRKEARGFEEFLGKYGGIKGYERDVLLARRVKERKEEIEKEDLSVDQLSEKLKDAKGIEKYALAEVLITKKKLPVDKALEILNDYRKESRIAGQAFQDRYEDHLMDKAEKAAFRNEDEFKKALELLREDSIDDFLRKAKKKNLLWVAKVRLKRKNPETEKLYTWEEAFNKELGGMNNKDISGLSKNSLNVADEKFGTDIAKSLEDIIGAKRLSDVLQFMSSEQKQALKPLTKQLSETSQKLQGQIGALEAEMAGPATSPTRKEELKGQIENLKVQGRETSFLIQKLNKVPEKEAGQQPLPPPPPVATGVSYREVRGGNVVDLRGIAEDEQTKD